MGKIICRKKLHTYPLPKKNLYILKSLLHFHKLFNSKMFTKISIITAILYSLLYVFTFSDSYAAGKGKLRGFVTDSTNGEPIGYANVVLKGTPLGSPTDNKGYYYIPSIPSGRHTIIVSYLGYQSRSVDVFIQDDKITQVDVKMVPSSIRLQEIAVVGERSVRDNEIDLGLQKISINEIEMMPTGFEADIFKTLQSSPGVSSTGDVTARYYVRGGNSNQNLVLLNGVTVYNPFHALGIYSVIDPEMISMMEFYKGGFGPEYGGRLSSVLNVITRDGNKNNYEASGTAGMLSGKVSFEGPIPGGSFLLTGRKSYYADVLSKYVNGKNTPFDFYDLSFKVNVAYPELLENGKFTLHGFFSGDKINNDDPLVEDYDMKNNIFGVNWYQIWASPLFSVISLSSSSFKAEVLPNMSTSKPRTNKLQDISSNWNFTYIYDSKDELDFGLEHKFLSTELQMQNLYVQKTNFKKNSYSLSGYAKYKFYRYEDFGIDLGMRVNFVPIAYKRPFLLEPRINFTWRLTPLFSIKAAVSRLSQEITTLSNENELISIFEPWTIIQDNLGAAETTHFLLGMQAFFTDHLSFELEGYYKDLNLLSEVNERKFTSSDPDYINVDGQSYGLEVLAKYQLPGFYFKTGYSLSWAYKINNSGEKYFPRYDYRHSLNCTAGLDLGWGFSANASWTFNSGMPYNSIVGFYDRMLIDDVWKVDPTVLKPTILWDRKNVKRLPYYHRLDIGLSKEFSTKFADFMIDASIINVYDRQNIFYIDMDTGKRIYMLPFMPSASLKVKL